MQYILVLYSDETRWPALGAEQQKQAMAQYAAYNEALRKADVLRGFGRLQPTSTAVTVHVGDGGAQVLDGPYVESKEQLGGFYLIDVPDLDAAITWAARCPASAHGNVEVRPLR
jgi:hypothetical protein